MQSVKGPGFRNVDDAGIFLPEDLVIPEPANPEGHQPQREDKGVKEEAAVAVHDEALPLLVHHKRHQGEGGEDEEGEDLALRHQVPARERDRRRPSSG